LAETKKAVEKANCVVKEEKTLRKQTITVILIVTTVYFAIRKPKTKQ